MSRVTAIKPKRQSLVQYLTISVALLAAVLTPLSTASAASSTNQGVANGFLISPVRNELTISKGQSQTVDITIQNPTNVATVAKAAVNDFVASDDESGDPRLILDSNTPPPHNDFRTLVSTIPNISLGPQEKKEIAVTLVVPSTASAGGYYGAIRFIPSTGNQQSTVGLTASVGTLFLVTVPGNLVEKLNLVQLSAAHQDATPPGSPTQYSATSILFSGNVNVLTRLQNVGDIHVQPFGKVEVKNMFGHVVASYEFNSTNPRANILPDSTRKFTDPLPKLHWFGRYTIESNLAYAQGSGNLLSATATFWYFPVWFVILVIVLLAAIVSIVYYLIVRRKRPAKSKR